MARDVLLKRINAMETLISKAAPAKAFPDIGSGSKSATSTSHNNNRRHSNYNSSGRRPGIRTLLAASRDIGGWLETRRSIQEYIPYYLFALVFCIGCFYFIMTQPSALAGEGGSSQTWFNLSASNLSIGEVFPIVLTAAAFVAGALRWLWTTAKKMLAFTFDQAQHSQVVGEARPEISGALQLVHQINDVDNYEARLYSIKLELLKFIAN